MCLLRFRKELSDILPLIEFAEFRLTLFVQLMGLSGYTERGSTVLDKAYPVKERGSYKMLVGRCDVPTTHLNFALRLLSDELGLERFRESVMENMSCEMNPDRKSIYDFLYRGSCLFMLMDVGKGLMRPFVKMYGSHEWFLVSDGRRLNRHTVASMGVTEESIFDRCGLQESIPED